MSEFNYTKFLTENRLTPFSKVLPMQESPQPVREVESGEKSNSVLIEIPESREWVESLMQEYSVTEEQVLEVITTVYSNAIESDWEGISQEVGEALEDFSNEDDEDMEEASFVGAPRGGAVKNMNFKEGEEDMYTVSFQVKHSEIAEAAKAQEISVEDVYQAIKEWYDQYTTVPGLFKEELEDQILNY